MPEGNSTHALRPVFQYDGVILRSPKRSDIQDHIHFGRHPEVHRMYGGHLDSPTIITYEEAEEWLERIAADSLLWMIEANKQCVGTARFHSLNQQDRRASYAIGLFHPDLCSKGIGTTATRLMLRYAFEELKLHRIDLRVLSFNQRAIASYLKCGFVCEGIEREGALIQGVWYDDLMMSILEYEYAIAAQFWREINS